MLKIDKTLMQRKEKTNIVQTEVQIHFSSRMVNNPHQWDDRRANCLVCCFFFRIIFFSTSRCFLMKIFFRFLDLLNLSNVNHRERQKWFVHVSFSSSCRTFFRSTFDKFSSTDFDQASSHVQWMVIRNNSSFLQKRKLGTFTTVSSIGFSWRKTRYCRVSSGTKQLEEPKFISIKRFGPSKSDRRWIRCQRQRSCFLHRQCQK